MTDRARLGPSPMDHQEQAENLDPDQNQGITGRQRKCRTRPGPKPVDHGETDRKAGSTRTKSSGSLGAHWSDGSEAEQREGRWKSKKLCSTCEQGCCGRSILAVASWVKHLGLKLHIVRPRLVRYACYWGGITYGQKTTVTP